MKNEKKYMEQGDGPKGDWRKLIIALAISAAIVTTIAFTCIKLFLSMDIQEKTYSEIIAEISIADERQWLADETNRETLNNTFFIDADGSAQTIQEGNGELLLKLSSPSFPTLISFRYEDGFLVAYQGRRRILLSFSDDMQAFALLIDETMIIFENCY
ncbi:MAG TPA: hypothetical protein IAB12_00010 [Candidatus Ornithospirochaeta avicola]|uniref:Uncharacterized protein n=1 Tax=Candidatus Ornithospirochaeta avicola TaxID=2840896 RepID=A0A9D1TM03_9SPIO|nr:hypothetical protein [Candidatus Ornithospirochaeta avicola]